MAIASWARPFLLQFDQHSSIQMPRWLFRFLILRHFLLSCFSFFALFWAINLPAFERRSNNKIWCVWRFSRCFYFVLRLLLLLFVSSKCTKLLSNFLCGFSCCSASTSSFSRAENNLLESSDKRNSFTCNCEIFRGSFIYYDYLFCFT